MAEQKDHNAREWIQVESLSTKEQDINIPDRDLTSWLLHDRDFPREAIRFHNLVIRLGRIAIAQRIMLMVHPMYPKILDPSKFYLPEFGHRPHEMRTCVNSCGPYQTLFPGNKTIIPETYATKT